MSEPIVSGRNHISSLEDYVDHWAATVRVYKVAPDATIEALKPMVRDALSFMLRHVASDFEKAAGLGISQAAKLIRDPNYYEQRKASRQRSRIKRAQREEEENRAEMVRNATPPTDDETIHERNRLESSAWYHRMELERIGRRLKELGIPPDVLRDVKNARPQ